MRVKLLSDKVHSCTCLVSDQVLREIGLDGWLDRLMLRLTFKLASVLW